MRVALVHDILTQYGGAEKVLKALSEIYPEAPIFTLVYNEEKLGGVFPKDRVKTSFLQGLPFAKKKYKWYLPLMPYAAESYNLSDFDLVISSDSIAFAKGVKIPPKAKHLCYCHTPTRYLWIDSEEYIEGLRYNRLVKKAILLILSRLKVWDAMSARRVDRFIANSKTVKSRIRKYYNRKSDVIYPPVETSRFFSSKEKGNYFLAGGRFVPYKKFDLIVDAFNKLGVAVKIFGEGPELARLKKKASKNIEFLGFVSEKEKARLYAGARAFIHPQEEDFGIILVEAMASGLPVIAYRAGGAKESLSDGIAGEFFYEQTWESLADKIINFDESKYNSELAKKEAEKFGVKEFKRRIEEAVCNI